MNPREKARQVFEQQSIAMQRQEDPIWPIAHAILQARDQALEEAFQLCQNAKDSGMEESILNYNEGCDDCAHGIMLLKGKIHF